MKDIDEMDMLGYLQILSWQANKEAAPKKSYIDKVWPGMSSTV